MNIKRQYPDTSISIFIAPPNLNELKNRLINRRTETSESIDYRLNKASKELTFSNKYDFVIINDNLEEATEEAKGIIYQFITKK